MSDQLHVSGPHAGEAVPDGAVVLSPDPETAEKKRKKKSKVRSAWISFVGRIVAQFIGAAATILLGLMVLQKYQAISPAAGIISPDSAPQAEQEVGTARVRPPDAPLSLAVLPLASFSSDEAHEHFANAMTEELITALSRMPGLRVISRTSSMYYKDQRRPLPEIGRELGVDLIVEGSIAKDADHVRIVAQLIDVETDEHIWAATYDRRFRNVLSLRAEVANQIAQDVNTARLSQPKSSPPHGARHTAEPVMRTAVNGGRITDYSPGGGPYNRTSGSAIGRREGQ